jgi:hypothetical protein
MSLEEIDRLVNQIENNLKLDFVITASFEGIEKAGFFEKKDNTLDRAYYLPQLLEVFRWLFP